MLAKVAKKLGFGKRTAPSRHKAYCEAFLSSIENGKPVPVPPEDARRSLELCTAIYTAAIEGRPVNLPLGQDTRFYHGITADDYNGRDGRA